MNCPPIICQNEEAPMEVPLLDLKRQNAPLAPELREAFERVLHSGQFILGREVEELERTLAPVAGARYAIGVSSGTDAILLALMALGIGPGDEVICPSFTFFATAGCIARIGATPVFADSCPVSFNLDVEDVSRRVTPRVKAIIPVHLFGQMADMDGLMVLARQHNLYVIEDAAQALGSTCRGRPAGSIGNCGAFSFYPSKNLGGFGDGGMLTTNDAGLAARARLLRGHGASPKYLHAVIGGNFRMDPLFAALLSVKTPHLTEYTDDRAANAAYYTAALSRIPGVRLSQSPATRILLPAALPDHGHIWNQYTLRVLPGAAGRQPGNPRDALRDFLAARKIGSEIYYPRPMHLQECFARMAVQGAPLPVAEQLASECLSIPIYPELTREQQDFVIAAIGDFLGLD
jgi:dTDP-4-amino-4,6-dideoxygalactose transaminase